MESLIVVVLIGGAIILGILNIVETIEYMRYRKAAHAVIALAHSMQESFNDVTNYLNRTNNQVTTLTQGTMAAEQDISFIKSVLFIHSQALNLNMAHDFELNKKSIEKLKEQFEEEVREINGANSTSTVQG